MEGHMNVVHKLLKCIKPKSYSFFMGFCIEYGDQKKDRFKADNDK